MSSNDGLKPLQPTISAENLPPEQGMELEQMESALQNLQAEQTANREKLKTSRESRIQNNDEILQLQAFIGILQEEIISKKKAVRAWKKTHSIK